MGELVKLGIYAAIALALAAFVTIAWNNFTGQYIAEGEVKGAAKQLAADTPVLDGVKKDRDTAQADRDQWKKLEQDREAENKTLGDKLQGQSDAIKTLNARTDAAIARTKLVEAEQAKHRVTFDADQARDKQILITPQPQRPADEELKLTDDIIRKALGFRAGIEEAQ